MGTWNTTALLFPDHGYLSSISICTFSSFRVRKQLPTDTGEQTAGRRCDVSHAHADAQAGCLAEPRVGVAGETVQAPGFLRIRSVTLYLSPCGRDIWHAGNRGFAVPRGQCGQKELRPAVF